MPPKNTPVKKRTFTNEMRRATIIEHAVATIAAVGYSNTTFARIAERAGLSSTRLISYHFAGKDELMNEVGRRVLDEFAAFVAPRVEAEPTKAGQLRVFLEANVDFIGARRPYVLALAGILDNVRGAGSTAALAANIVESDLTALQELLRDGQRAGEFRPFDTRVMAVAVLALRNAVIDQLSANPDLDLDPYRRELAQLVDIATGVQAGRGEPR
jgi:AcrR family transcriptional regulator